MVRIERAVRTLDDMLLSNSLSALLDIALASILLGIGGFLLDYFFLHSKAVAIAILVVASLPLLYTIRSLRTTFIGISRFLDESRRAAAEIALQKTVLLLHLNRRLESLLSRELSSLHYKVSVSHRLDDALVEMDRRRPDVVILDITMPKLQDRTEDVRQLVGQFLRKSRSPLILVAREQKELAGLKEFKSFVDFVLFESKLAKDMDSAAIKKKVEEIISKVVSDMK